VCHSKVSSTFLMSASAALDVLYAFRHCLYRGPKEPLFFPMALSARSSRVLIRLLRDMARFCRSWDFCIEAFPSKCRTVVDLLKCFDMILLRSCTIWP
ncbi:hypothetical protein BC939DRAFT_434585, partial [Gamsiella multidivaricata]|uniref:uncharacterized protein n=1 Tax=Gamsiella multidivaricata TaxID=101098 RepID=UPI00221F5245